MRKLVIIFLVVFFNFGAHAAKPTGLGAPDATPELYRQQNPIAKTQEILRDLGYYLGTIDGFMGSDLESAIKLYEKEHGLDQNGKISTELLQHMENIARVRALIRRLDDVRQQKQEKAREALLADPRTRKLLESQQDEVADPTRDSSACFKNTTPACLMVEAVASSRAVFEDDMRDWALGEILAAQVAIGMDEDAMQTASRIRDSRLVIAALTSIAKTHAREGNINEAIAGIGLIPVPQRRLSVLLEIAAIYRDQAQNDKLRETIDEILQTAPTIDPFEEALTLQIEAVALLATIDKPRALALLDEMTKQASTQAKNGSRVTLMRQAVSTAATIGYPEWALKTLNDMPDDETRIPVLMAATRAFLKSGRFDAAQTTISRIAADRYRSIILADMARALWDAQKHERALKAIEEAYAIASAITLPFAKNFSYSNIAQTLTHIASLSQKREHADRAYIILNDISDDRLKARGLWDLAHAANQYRFNVSDGDLDLAASDAMRDIKSNFSRAWVLGDLVEIHLAGNNREQARKAFDLGMKTVESLTNSWARARALAKFAVLSYRLD